MTPWAREALNVFLARPGACAQNVRGEGEPAHLECGGGCVSVAMVLLRMTKGGRSQASSTRWICLPPSPLPSSLAQFARRSSLSVLLLPNPNFPATVATRSSTKILSHDGSVTIGEEDGVRHLMWPVEVNGLVLPARIRCDACNIDAAGTPPLSLAASRVVLLATIVPSLGIWYL